MNSRRTSLSQKKTKKTKNKKKKNPNQFAHGLIFDNPAQCNAMHTVHLVQSISLRG